MSTAAAHQAKPEAESPKAKKAEDFRPEAPVRRNETWGRIATGAAPPPDGGGSEPPPGRTKLFLGPTDDASEREADRVAEALSRPSLFRVSGTAAASPGRVQRKCATCASGDGSCPSCREDEEIRRQPLSAAAELQGEAGGSGDRAGDGGAGGTPLSARLAWRVGALRSGGSPFGEAERAYFEPRFGRDFSRVRIHADAEAADTSRQLGARAFTVGSDIVFGKGQYAPDRPVGRRLLAHELTHVVQQGAGAPGTTVQREPEAAPAGELGEGVADVSEPEPTWEEVQQLLGADAESTVEGVPDLQEEEPAADEGPAESAAEPMPAPAGVEESAGPRETSTVDGEEVEEIEIPDFDSGGPAFCGDLVPEPAPVDERGDESAGSGTEAFFEKMLEFVPGVGGLTTAIPGMGWVQRLAGRGLEAIWRRLPLATRVTAVNLALDSFEFLWRNAVKLLVPPPSGLWLEAGVKGFFDRIRKMPDASKVAVFEKVGAIFLGRSGAFTLGYIKGLFRGFVVDGLVGIVQMIIDIICLIPQVSTFLKKLQSLFGGFTVELENLYISIGLLELAVDEALKNALKELKQLLSSPRRVLSFLAAIHTQAKRAHAAVGEALAQALIDFYRLPASAMGFKVGRVAGFVAFEVVLALISGGSGLLATGAKVVARTAVKVLATVGRNMLAVVRLVGRILPFLRNAVVSLSRGLTPAFRTVGSRLGHLLDSVGAFFRKLLKICRRGSTHCKVPKKRGLRARRRSARDLYGRERGRPGSRRCDKRFVSRLGGWPPHDRYVRRTTGTTRDYRVSVRLGRRWTCTYDAFRRSSRLLVEGKTGYGWLANPSVRRRWWFPLALARLEEQRYRCLAIATMCGPYRYEWWMQNRGAARYLNSRWAGIPPVHHRP